MYCVGSLAPFLSQRAADRAFSVTRTLPPLPQQDVAMAAAPVDMVAAAAMVMDKVVAMNNRVMAEVP